MLIVFWWQLMLHHNSEKYNLSVALLGWWTQHIKFIFFYSYNFNGFDPVLFFFICHQIEYSINSGFILNILETGHPRIHFCYTSHHRVHHSTNDQYMNKFWINTYYLGQNVWYFWSRGRANTFMVLQLTISYNPVTLNFHEWKDMSIDVLKVGH
jgi:hypothetical protein